MKKFFTLISAIIMLGGTFAKSAVTVDTVVVGSSGKHKLYIALPNNYDPSKAYPLVIGLHYCGGTAKEFRKAMTPFIDSLHMIVACPDNNTAYFDDGKVDLIKASIDSACAMFNVDTTLVYLTGMSCNSEVVLKKGLKAIYPFKGIFPWAPYVQSFNKNGMNFNSTMPVTIAIGTRDQYYYEVVLNLYDSLKHHGANVNLVLVPGINHTLDFPEFGNEMIHSFYYISDTNNISIRAVKGNADRYELFDTAAERQIVYKISDKAKKELVFKTYSSVWGIINDPTVSYNPVDSLLTLKFKPSVGRKGRVILVLEAMEKNGTAIEQATFSVDVKMSPVSVSELKTNTYVEVYPNPATSKLFLKNTASGLLVEVADLNGRTLLKTKYDAANGIDVRGLKQGLYILKAIGEKNRYTVKFSVN